MYSLVPAPEYDSPQPVELGKLDWRRRVARHHPDDAAFDLRWWTEVVLAHVHHEVDLGVQLDVCGQTRPERGSGGRHQPCRELALEHEDGDAEYRTVGEEPEYERGRYLVRGVGDADVKVGEGGLDEVANDDLELTLFGSGIVDVRGRGVG